MKKRDRFATGIWRFVVGLIGLSIAALMFQTKTEDFTFFKVVATGGILFLFIGYALGFDKQMQNFILGIGKKIKKHQA
ncbi:hypothetical protein KUL17_18840 [Alteromonas sp. KUL17]|uniref:hypothetical protein n=1 Tax=Alteromonas sp. KUL17 TaxID=2480796 RepID=UPI0010374A3E|nr:hypothetical protein [Alteromonas sp. KUL17]TAP26682.1 hypothetical protein KUL49_09340 [Alteromonas sp. KUL17]GEA02987.1 hypothetical protein KUL17_18840 [Alteromonas sp. KUL17]